MQSRWSLVALLALAKPIICEGLSETKINVTFIKLALIGLSSLSQLKGRTSNSKGRTSQGSDLVKFCLVSNTIIRFNWLGISIVSPARG